MVTHDFYWMLPVKFQLSWSLYFADSDNKMTSLFLNITQEKADFKKLVGRYESRSFVEALQKYSEPKVRCFCGASEFIYDCGLVGFNNLLNYIFT